MALVCGSAGLESHDSCQPACYTGLLFYVLTGASFPVLFHLWQVYLASASPPVKYPNVYGVDMPSRKEFVADGLNEDQVGRATHHCFNPASIAVASFVDHCCSCMAAHPCTAFSASSGGCHVWGRAVKSHMFGHLFQALVTMLWVSTQCPGARPATQCGSLHEPL